DTQQTRIGAGSEFGRRARLGHRELKVEDSIRRHDVGRYRQPLGAGRGGHGATPRRDIVPFDTARDVETRMPLVHEGAAPQVGVYRSLAGLLDHKPDASTLGDGPGPPIFSFAPTVGQAPHAVAPESECKGLAALNYDLASTPCVPDRDRSYT